MKNRCEYCGEIDPSVERRQTNVGRTPKLCAPCFIDAKRLVQQQVVVPIELARFSPRALEVMANA